MKSAESFVQKSRTTRDESLSATCGIEDISAINADGAQVTNISAVGLSQYIGDFDNYTSSPTDTLQRKGAKGSETLELASQSKLKNNQADKKLLEKLTNASKNSLYLSEPESPSGDSMLYSFTAALPTAQPKQSLKPSSKVEFKVFDDFVPQR